MQGNLLTAKVEDQRTDVEESDHGIAQADADHRPRQAEQQAFAEENGHQLAGLGADRRQRADFADALINGHQHHVHHAHQHDGDQHDANEHRHQVDHAHDVGEGRQVGPQVQLGRRLAFLVLDFIQFGVEALLHRFQFVDRFEAHGDFHHLRLLRA